MARDFSVSRVEKFYIFCVEGKFTGLEYRLNIYDGTYAASWFLNGFLFGSSQKLDRHTFGHVGLGLQCFFKMSE